MSTIPPGLLVIGRAGRTGTAIMICIPRDEKNLEDVEQLVKQEIPRLDNPMPAPEEKPKRERRKKDDAPKADAPAETPKRQDKPKPSRGGRGRGREPEVVGMGDEPPAFIAMSFAERAKV